MSGNREAAELVGIPTTRVLALAFGLGVALAGVSGMLIGTLFPFTVLSGDAYQLKSFVVTVLGGLGNPTGALIGGLALGLFEGLSTPFMPVSWTLVFEFVLFVVVTDRLPRRAPQPALAAARRMSGGKAADECDDDPAPPLLGSLAVAHSALAVAPTIGNNVELRESLLLAAVPNITLASNLNLILGCTGYVNFGSIVFSGSAAISASTSSAPSAGVWHRRHSWAGPR